MSHSVCKVERATGTQEEYVNITHEHKWNMSWSWQGTKRPYVSYVSTVAAKTDQGKSTFVVNEA